LTHNFITSSPDGSREAGPAYEDFVEGKMTDEFWRRKWETWERTCAGETEIVHL